MEHEWEELFVVRDGENVYAGIDRCNNNNCKAIRAIEAEGTKYRYRLALWRDNIPQTSIKSEPPCIPEGAGLWGRMMV